MTRIAIEALGIDRSGGGRTSILNTIKALPQVAPDLQFWVYLSRSEADFYNIPQIKQRVIASANRFVARLKIQWLLPREVRRNKIDLVHFTKNLMTGFLPCARVVTVHDLTTLRYPETQSAVDVAYWRWIEPFHLRRADSIIAVSWDAAHDLSAIYGISPQRIQVIHWAPDDRFRRPVDRSAIEHLRAKYHLPDRYLLFLGILAKKKNLKTLIQAMAMLRGSDFAPHLVIAGRPYSQSDASDDLELINVLGLGQSVHYIGEVPDNDLPALYAGADVYLLPSLHEGFGIPCWEAMALGVPVIASRRGALSEIVSTAGLLIEEPLDVGAWVDAIRRVTRDSQLRAELIQRGRRQIDDRTWRTVAAETCTVYRSLLQKR